MAEKNDRDLSEYEAALKYELGINPYAEALGGNPESRHLPSSVHRFGSLVVAPTNRCPHWGKEAQDLFRRIAGIERKATKAERKQHRKDRRLVEEARRKVAAIKAGTIHVSHSRFHGTKEIKVEPVQDRVAIRVKGKKPKLVPRAMVGGIAHTALNEEASKLLAEAGFFPKKERRQKAVAIKPKAETSTGELSEASVYAAIQADRERIAKENAEEEARTLREAQRIAGFQFWT